MCPKQRKHKCHYRDGTRMLRTLSVTRRLKICKLILKSENFMRNAITNREVNYFVRSNLGCSTNLGQDFSVLLCVYQMSNCDLTCVRYSKTLKTRKRVSWTLKFENRSEKACSDWLQKLQNRENESNCHLVCQLPINLNFKRNVQEKNAFSESLNRKCVWDLNSCQVMPQGCNITSLR